MKSSASYILKSTLQGIAGIAVMSAAFVLIAGRWDYVQGWVLIGFYVITMPFMYYVFRGKQDLMKERRKPGPGVKLWDRFIVQILKLLLVGTYVIAILDTGRYLWSPTLPVWMYVVAYMVYIVASAIPMWATSVNNYFSSHVRIQKDRGHKVVDTGPYAYIRHPGYAFMIIGAPATALIFGSMWALIPALLQVPIIVIRTALEDKTLQEELPGYKEYAKRVPYRLMQHVW